MTIPVQLYFTLGLVPGTMRSLVCIKHWKTMQAITCQGQYVLENPYLLVDPRTPDR